MELPVRIDKEHIKIYPTLIVLLLAVTLLQVLLWVSSSNIGGFFPSIPTIGDHASNRELKQSIFTLSVVLLFGCIGMPIASAVIMLRGNRLARRILGLLILSEIALYVCLSQYERIVIQALTPNRGVGDSLIQGTPHADAAISSTPLLIRPVFAPFIAMVDFGYPLSVILLYCVVWGFLLMLILDFLADVYRQHFRLTPPPDR